ENLGWGPWSVFEYAPPLLHDTVVRGQPCEFRMIGAETSVDGLGFELIQPVSGPSLYQEFLDTHGEGVQHIACMKHSADDSALMQEHWRANGAEVLMSGRIGESIEFYYLDTAPMLKFVLESGSGHAIDLKPPRRFPGLSGAEGRDLDEPRHDQATPARAGHAGRVRRDLRGGQELG